MNTENGATFSVICEESIQWISLLGFYFYVRRLMYTFQLKKGCTPFQGHESLWSLDALRIPLMAWFAFSILCILLMMYCVLTQT